MLPLVRWRGGKRRLATAICDHIATRGTPTRLSIPFAGMLGVGLHAAERWPGLALEIADADEWVALVWREVIARPSVVAASADELHAGSLWPDAEREKARFYAVREALSDRGPRGAWEAGQWLWLQGRAFSGVSRRLKSGRLGQTAGTLEITSPTTADILRASSLLSASRARHRDAIEAIREAGDGDTLYLDPPYVTEATERSYGAWSVAHSYSVAIEARCAADRGADVWLSDLRTAAWRYPGAVVVDEWGHRHRGAHVAHAVVECLMRFS